METGCNDSPWAGWSAVRLPVWQQIVSRHTGPCWPWGPPSLQYKGYRDSFPEQRGRDVALTTHSFSAEVKERIEPYLHLPFVPALACYRVTLTFMCVMPYVTSNKP